MTELRWSIKPAWVMNLTFLWNISTCQHIILHASYNDLHDPDTRELASKSHTMIGWVTYENIWFRISVIHIYTRATWLCEASELLELITSSRSIVVFCVSILYSECLPASWREEEAVSVTLLQGEFSMATFAEAIIPMANCVPFIVEEGAVTHGPGQDLLFWLCMEHVNKYQEI